MADEQSMESYAASRKAGTVATVVTAPEIDLKNALPDPAEPPAEPVDSEAKPDNTDRTSANADGEATDSPEESGEGKRDIPPWVKARITREANKARAADEARLQAIRERDEALAKIPPPPDPKAIPRPQRDAFDDPDSYESALLDWKAEQTRADVTAELEAKRARDEQVRQVEQTLSTYSERRKAFEADHSDYADLVDREDLKITPAMSQAILTASDGPAIAYHLGQNPEEAERIAALPAAMQLYEIGRISAGLARPRREPKPAPISPLRSNNSGASERSPDEMSMAEYMAWRKAN